MRKEQWRAAIIIVVLIVLSAGISFFSVYSKFLNSPLVPPDKPLDYIMKPGASVRVLSDDLQKLGLLKRPLLLEILAYQKGVANDLKAGEYLFAPGTTPAQLLTAMAAGKVHYHKFTLIEGWNFQQVLAAINVNPHLMHTLANASNGKIAEEINLPPSNPEGLFFPATYYFTSGTRDIDILRRANQTMSRQLAQAWEKRAADLPYKNSYEALIAASLVEKETARSAERPLIASVITQRLQKNMRLQIDSAVTYGVGQNYTGKLSRANLKQDNPYNTYRRNGLPPTPIAMPSGEAIRAIMHPAEGQYLYFVAKGDGSHQFSQTLGEHNKAVDAYQLKITLPKIGRLYNSFDCRKLWYASALMQNIVGRRCVLR